VGEHERQAAHHRAAAAADRQCAERAQSAPHSPEQGGVCLSPMSPATAWPGSGNGLTGDRANMDGSTASVPCSARRRRAGQPCPAAAGLLVTGHLGAVPRRRCFVA
jgi:hypothetical protein